MNFLIGLTIILFDQIIKAIIVNIPDGTAIGSFIRITNISNTGMAYSIR